MPIPQAVQGLLLDVKRLLAFRDDVEVSTLILYDVDGEELVRLTEFWHVEKPRIRFGDSHETVRFLVTENETELDETMGLTRMLRYEVKDVITAEVTLSPPHRCSSVPTPPLGRNRQWVISTTTTTGVNEFFVPPGQ